MFCSIKMPQCPVCSHSYNASAYELDNHFNMKVRCPVCAATLSRIEVLKRHIQTQHPDSRLAFRLEDLRRSTGFFFADEPREWNPEAPHRPLPTETHEMVESLYARWGIRMPSREGMNCPATAREAARRGLTRPANHGSHGEVSVFLTEEPTALAEAAALPAIKNDESGGPSTSAMSPAQTQGLLRMLLDLEQAVEVETEEAPAAVVNPPLPEEVVPPPPPPEVPDVGVEPQTGRRPPAEATNADLELHPTEEDREEVQGEVHTLWTPARQEEGERGFEAQPQYVFTVIEVATEFQGEPRDPMRVRLLCRRYGVPVAIYEIGVRIQYNPETAEMWRQRGALFPASGPHTRILDACPWVTRMTGQAADKMEVRAILAREAGSRPNQLTSFKMRTRQSPYAVGDRLMEFGFLLRALPRGDELRRVLQPLRVFGIASRDPRPPTRPRNIPGSQRETDQPGPREEEPLPGPSTKREAHSPLESPARRARGNVEEEEPAEPATKSLLHTRTLALTAPGEVTSTVTIYRRDGTRMATEKEVTAIRHLAPAPPTDQ